MATTYFGYCDPSTGAGTGTTYIYPQKFELFAAGYTCPGTGSQTVIDLSAETSDSPGSNFNMGIYNAAGNLVVEGTAEKACAYPTAWVTWGASDLTWHIGTTLTGGATYRIAYAAGGSNRCMGTDGQPSGTSLYVDTDYSGGLPATLPSLSNDTIIVNLRCGVEPAGGATYDKSVTFSSSPACSNSPKVDFFPSLAFVSTPSLSRAAIADLLGGVTFASTPALNRAGAAGFLSVLTLASGPALSTSGGMSYFNTLVLSSTPAAVMAYLLAINPTLSLTTNPALVVSALGNFYNSLILASTPGIVSSGILNSLADVLFSALPGFDVSESIPSVALPTISAPASTLSKVPLKFRTSDPKLNQVLENYQTGINKAITTINSMQAQMAPGPGTADYLIKVNHAGAEWEYQSKAMADIRDYGAEAGDVVDCTTAIQAALDSGKNVYIPDGIYKTTAELELKVGQTRRAIFGNGFGSIIKAYGCNALKVSAQQVNLSSFMLWEGDADKSGNGLTINGAHGSGIAFSTYHNLFIYGFDLGLDVKYASANNFSDILIWVTNKALRLFGHCVGNNFSNLIGYSGYAIPNQPAGTYALRLEHDSAETVNDHPEGNVFVNVQAAGFEDGLQIDRAYYNAFSQCIFDFNYRYGANLEDGGALGNPGYTTFSAGTYFGMIGSVPGAGIYVADQTIPTIGPSVGGVIFANYNLEGVGAAVDGIYSGSNVNGGRINDSLFSGFKKSNITIAGVTNIVSGNVSGTTGLTNKGIYIKQNTNIIGINYMADGIKCDSGITFISTLGKINMGSGNVVPTFGTWGVGDIYWHDDAAPGEPIGWYCTGAGTPGTWAGLAEVGFFDQSPISGSFVPNKYILISCNGVMYKIPVLAA